MKTPGWFAKWLRRAACGVIVAAAAPFVVFFTLDYAFPFPRERLRDAVGAHSPMLLAEDGSLLSWRVDHEERWRLPVRLDEVSPWLERATVAVEDKRFPEHFGVDPIAVARALAGNLVAGKTVSGASTLSMQTVRLLWQRPRRLPSKIVEAFRAVQLERLVGKRGVLELYFNLAPYGGNIVGVEAAARRYFGKSARALTLGEASLLAGIPQSPSRLLPTRYPEKALRRRRHVLHCMAANGMIAPEEAERAAEEPLDLEKPHARPGLLHFADWAASAFPNPGGIVRTTLRTDWQDTVDRVVRKNASLWEGRGLSGPAVVVLDTRDSSVLAYLGNATESAGWQVDGVRAPRQPGSLLKPFLFATLADQGRLVPSTRERDIPAEWSGYAPQNIDREWSGDIAAGEALRMSRNVPAVRQLSRLGVGNFAGVMDRLGLPAGNPSRQGLTMALGAREQRLVDLANAYAALARLGQWLPVTIRAAAGASGEKRRVWSEEAAWLTIYALSPPLAAAPPRLVWKTGTSWNHRDAWAVVLTREAVVGVWVGRTTGATGSRVTGAETSLPLALEIADALGLGRDAGWSTPDDIVFVEVCAASGDVPGWNCPETLSTPIIKGKRSARSCAMHLGGQAADAANGELKRPEESAAPEKRLTLLSPSSGACYVMAEEEGAANTLAFQAEHDGSDGILYWFVDDKIAGSSKRGETFHWRMEPGSHVLTVSDEQGRSRTAAFSVALRGFREDS